MKKNILCLIAIILSVWTASAQTTTITIQPHFNGIENQLAIMDSTSSYWATNLKKYEEDSCWHDRKDIIFCAWTSLACPETFRQIIRFAALTDTSVIPANSTINSAQLILYGLPADSNNYGNSYYPATPYPLSNMGKIYELADSFNNLTVNWNTQPAISLNDSVMVPLSQAQWNENDTFDVTALVAHMIVNGNYGFMLRLESESYYQEHLYASSRYSDSTLHPALIVNYTHNSTGISDLNASGAQMQVYPTLVTSNINVGINVNQYATVDFQIFDMQGKKVYSVNKYCKYGANNFAIPTSILPQGTYLIRATAADDVNLAQKFIKE